MDADDVSMSWWRRLGRVLRRRSPASWWQDLTPGEADDDHGKQALRVIIERRRRHDLVRLRELTQLRLMRHRGVRHGETSTGTHFLDSAFSALDEREVTLRKIDDIEAQMSRQWWAKAAAPVAADQPEVAASGFALTQFSGDVTSAELACSGASRPPIPAPPLRRRPPMAELEPVLAEAALRWAAGAGAEAVALLLQALREPGAQVPRALYLRALLDLYRAMRQRDRFEQAWSEFAGAAPSPAWQIPGDAPAGAFVMDAELTGDLTALLTRLTAACEQGQPLLLSCARLQRVDFAAAGTLLAWLQGSRCELELRDLSPLVATFFELLGMDELARLHAKPV